jgi:hypothetical protein
LEEDVMDLDVGKQWRVCAGAPFRGQPGGTMAKTKQPRDRLTEFNTEAVRT